MIVNRVNPETGIAAPLSNDHLKLSAWAEEYERTHGRIFCEQRVENNKRRRQEFVKDRASPKEGEFHRWRKARMEAEFQRRQQEKADLARAQQDERDGLASALKALTEERRREQKELQKPLWAALYKEQRADKRTFERAQKTTFGRLRYWLKNRHLDRYGGDSLDRQGMLARAFNIVVNRDIMAKALAAKHEADRRALSERCRADTAERLASIYRAHDRRRDELRREQESARTAQRERHSRESQEAARRIAKGGDRAAFDFDKARAGQTDPEKTLRDTIMKRPDPFRAAFDKAAAPPGRPPAGTGREEGDSGSRTPPAQDIEKGEAARMIREARRRGLDESAAEKGDRDEGTGEAFRAFRDAQERKSPAPSQERTEGETEGGKAFRAFRNAQERRDQDRGREADPGREIERKPPKSPGET